MMLSGSVTSGINTTIGFFMNTFFWGLTASQMAWLAIAQLVSAGITFSFLKPIGERIDKHRISAVCYFMFGLNTAWLIAPRLLGILPDNDHWIIYPLIVVQAYIWQTFLMLNSIMLSSYTADVVDEHDYNTGHRQEGMFYAFEAFAAKSVTGMGNWVGGIILDVVKFPMAVTLGRAVTQDDISDGVLFNLGVIMGPILSVTFVVPFVLSLFLRLNRKRHGEIKELLIRRQEEAAEAAAPDV